MKIKSTLERGLPVSLSRWTDVAHWYMPWLKDVLLNKKIIFATDPESLTLSMWDARPEHVHSLYFWTKYPKHLTTALKEGWIADWRVFVALTITGWEEVETRVPALDKQLDAAKALVDVLGIEKTRWRYSPVPNDFHYNTARQEHFERLCYTMAQVGYDEVDVSLLQPSPHWKEGYQNPDSDLPGEKATRIEVLATLVRIASSCGVRVGVCADDLALMHALASEEAQDCFSTSCVDRARLDRVFQLDTAGVPEHGCTCQLSIDPCQGQQFGCASACRYCYVPFTKIPK